MSRRSGAAENASSLPAIAKSKTREPRILHRSHPCRLPVGTDLAATAIGNEIDFALAPFCRIDNLESGNTSLDCGKSNAGFPYLRRPVSLALTTAMVMLSPIAAATSIRARR
jgi:hypothetical protein